MLSALACLFAPRPATLLEQSTPELPDPLGHDALADRAVQALADVAALELRDEAGLDGAQLLLAMGCRDLALREANQDPELAGRPRTWEGLPFAPVSVPATDGLSLTGRRSTGAPGAPMVVVVHGLLDSHGSSYVVELSEALRRMGFHVVALDVRDHGGLRGKGPTTSLGPAEGRDLLAAVRALTKGEDVSVGLLGLSFGGVCVAHAAHEATRAGAAQLLRGGVMTIASPLDMRELVEGFDARAHEPVLPGRRARFIQQGARKVLIRHLGLRVPADAPRSARRSIRAFVDEVVAPSYADGDLSAWLDRTRVTRADLLGQLEVPTLLVHSEDDPLIPMLHLERAREAARGNPLVGTLALPFGGHVGLPYAAPTGTLELLATWFGGLRDG